MLERYFRLHYIEQKNITRIGGFWDRKGENEIDLIVVDEINKKAEIVEVKRNAANIDIETLKRKSVNFFNSSGELGDFQVIYKGLSMNDM